MDQEQNELGKSPPTKHSRRDITMEKEQISKEDKDLYVLQYFLTTSEELTDNIFNLCVSHMVKLFPAIKMTFEGVMGKDEKEMLRKGLDKFVKLFYSALEKRTDVFNIYLKDNLINIPDNLILRSDVAQLKYKSLVETLNSNRSSAKEKEFTEENTADLLTLEANKLLERLKRTKMEKFSLEREIREQNQLMQRIEKIEQNVSTLNESLPSSVCEYVSKNIAAAADVSTLKL